ncbi:MAG: alpha-glucosidase/alpha-galactosidase [Sedimentisphaeraceae bacterium JB056]
MKPVVTFIGAGSFIFARKIIVDLLTFEEMHDMELRLMDIDSKKLEIIYKLALQINKQVGANINIVAESNRVRAIDGADFVLAMFDPDGLDARRIEVGVPMKHGVPQAVGDTLGPGGIFKGIRTSSVLVDIARDMEVYCPNAWLLNYVNPMAINCWAVNELTTIKCIGMCHGLEHTLTRLAKYLGLDGGLETKAGGINHMCWLLSLSDNGQNVYPMLWEKMQMIMEDDPIRGSIMKTFGYFVTESPYHIAEYLPYFTRRFADLKVCSEEAGNLNIAMGGWEGYIITPSSGGGGQVEQMIPKAWDIQLYDGIHGITHRKHMEQIASGEPVEIKLSEEYSGRIIHSILTNTPRRMSLNVENNGFVTNLSQGCVVEVPAYVDGIGIHPEGLGNIPSQCAALCQRNVDVQSQVINAIVNRDRQSILYAMLLDPLTGASLEPLEIEVLFDDLVQSLGDMLPKWLRN